MLNNETREILNKSILILSLTLTFILITIITHFSYKNNHYTHQY